MTTATATLEGVPVTRCRVQVPAWGLWWADVELAEPEALAGAVTLAIADVELEGAIVSGGPADGRAGYRLVAGAGGWGRELPARGYADDAGVKIASVVRDAAAAAGEAVEGAPTTRTGPHYVRAAGPASAVLNALAPRAWYAGLDGVVRFGARPAAVYAGSAVLVDRSPAAGCYVFAADELAGLEPGAQADADALPAVDAEYELEGARLTARLYTGPRTSVIPDALALLLEALDPRRRYRGTYEFRVVTQTGNRLNLQPVRASSGLSDLLRVPVRLAPGLRAEHALGSLVLVTFVDADPSRPVVIAGDDADAPGWAPTGLVVGGTGDRVALASEVDARLAEIKSVFNAHTHLSAAPGSPTGAPVPTPPAPVALWPLPTDPATVASGTVEVSP